MNIKFYTALITILSMSVTGSAQAASCSETTPLRTVISIGGGQSSSINNTMYVQFTGHITTTDGLTNRGKNTVTICDGTTVTYQAIGGTTTLRTRAGTIESLVPASCGNRSATGTLSPGDTLVCNNKNTGGSDTDRFRVVSAR